MTDDVCSGGAATGGVALLVDAGEDPVVRSEPGPGSTVCGAHAEPAGPARWPARLPEGDFEDDIGLETERPVTSRGEGVDDDDDDCDDDYDDDDDDYDDDDDLLDDDDDDDDLLDDDVDDEDDVDEL